LLLAIFGIHISPWVEKVVASGAAVGGDLWQKRPVEKVAETK
jgi:hypothetical protein